MPRSTLLPIASLIVLVIATLVPEIASAQALKTAKLCNDEYAAQKPAKETKKEFVTACRTLPIGTAGGLADASNVRVPSSFGWRARFALRGSRFAFRNR